MGWSTGFLSLVVHFLFEFLSMCLFFHLVLICFLWCQELINVVCFYLFVSIVGVKAHCSGGYPTNLLGSDGSVFFPKFVVAEAQCVKLQYLFGVLSICPELVRFIIFLLFIDWDNGFVQLLLFFIHEEICLSVLGISHTSLVLYSFQTH